MTKTMVVRFIPLILFLAMAGLFAKMLTTDRNPAEIKSVLINTQVRPFSLDGLRTDDIALTQDDLAKGEITVVNFFASWCVPCRAEHAQLMALQKAGIKVIGIAYQNEAADAIAFLDDLGDPFESRIMDYDGRVGIDWGVYGVPETFIVRGDGTIAYKHFGPLLEYNFAQFMQAYEEVKG